MKKYKKIRVHWRPGLDEITAIFLLQRHGAEIGIDRDTPVKFMTNGDFENPPMDKTDGELYVGCGLGSWANEHFMTEIDLSACHLVARHLRLSRKRYGAFVDLVTEEDRKGAGGVKSHIAQAIKDLYDMGWMHQRVYNWVKTAIIALTDWDSRPGKLELDTVTCAQAIDKKFGTKSSQRWFKVVEQILKWQKGEFIKARAYIDKNPNLFLELETHRGKLKCFVPDEVQFNARITAAARSRGAQVLLLQGALDFDQIGIMLQQKHTAGISFSGVLEELRKHELSFRGEANVSKAAQCAGEGTLAVCPVWHGHQASTGQSETFAVYNRSKSRPRGPKTVLPWDYIQDLVSETLKVSPQGKIVKGMTNTFLVGDSDLNRVFQQKKPSMSANQ